MKTSERRNANLCSRQPTAPQVHAAQATAEEGASGDAPSTGTGFRAWTDTATIRDALATVWGGETVVLVSSTCPTGADRITIWIRTPDLHGGLCAGHPYPSPWDAELDGAGESAAQRARRHREAQTICRLCPIMAACLDSRMGNPQLGGGVWGGEVFEEKESTAGDPAPSQPPLRLTGGRPA